jgi:isopentenyl-diphosphate delta-isomerase
LKFLGKFQYQAVYRNSEIEKEICALLVGRYQGKIQPNFQEIENYKWVNFQKLAKEIKKRRNKKYTPWLKLALKNYQNF